MNLETFLSAVRSDGNALNFSDLMDVIDANYSFTPTQFKNGELLNEAGQNDGSCKLFSFAKIHQLSESQTLACFGAYYRDDVLKHPDEDNHQNIRNFMKTGWAGIQFNSDALSTIAI